jgi:hypothetical protein
MMDCTGVVKNVKKKDIGIIMKNLLEELQYILEHPAAKQQNLECIIKEKCDNNNCW